MAWAASFIVTLVLGVMVLLNAPKLPEAARPFAATGAVAVAIFTLVQFLVNQFGFDRDGFRALVLSPAERRLLLLGKNLAALPVGIAFGGTLLVLTSVWLRLSPLIVAAGFFQLSAALVLAGLGGNVLSILVPYRIAPGSMKPTKMPTGAMLVMVFCQLLFPLAMTPVFVAPLGELLWRMAGWPSAVPVNLLLSAALAALAAYGYGQSLGPMGRLLQRREMKILDVVSVEVE
jgi:ABC-2 type transport system permease protein